MIRPNPLKVGDTVALVGASSSVDFEKIQPAVKSLENLGLNVVVAPSCYMKHGFLAAPDNIRAKEINDFFADKNIHGIINIRGGYGSQRLLDKLDYELIKQNPKVFAGYSDTTALHIAINQKCGFITYHSPMPTSENYDIIDKYTKDNLIGNLFNNIPLGLVANPEGELIETVVDGYCEGIITGGNLCLITSSLGTEYEIDTKDKIIFIEEVGEEPYRIDRMLLQLKYARKFKDCAGIIFGAFTACEAENPNKSLTYKQIFEELINDENKPTISNFRCGHCLPTITIPLGSQVKLDATKGEVYFL